MTATGLAARSRNATTGWWPARSISPHSGSPTPALPLKTTALIFHSEPMMTAINHARALEDDGTFGTTARDAWKLAGDEMRRFAMREIPTSWDVPIRLGLREVEEERAKRIAAELEALLPGQFAALAERKRAALPADQKAALDVPPFERSEKQQELAARAETALRVTWTMVAREAPPETRDKAKELARQHVEATETATMIDRYRDIVNFDFWRATCEMEVTEPALRAASPPGGRSGSLKTPGSCRRRRPTRRRLQRGVRCSMRRPCCGKTISPPKISPNWSAATARCSTSWTKSFRSPSCCRMCSTVPGRWRSKGRPLAPK